MRPDFFDAQQRHWVDAEHLLQAQRWANADHLYGMAAECGLKQLMLIFNMPYDAAKDRPAERSDFKVPCRPTAWPATHGAFSDRASAWQRAWAPSCAPLPWHSA